MSSRLTEEAWVTARAEIERLQGEAVDRKVTNDLTSWTPDMLAWLGAKLLRQPSIAALAPPGKIAALRIPWRDYANPEPLRRQVIVDKQLRDFPASHRTLPTKFGNILRAHEDQTGRDQVETLVLDVLHELPAPLRRLHDDTRNRLDLYATMIFVEGIIAALALARMIPNHWGYGLAIAGAMIFVAWLTYRAAMASGRIYGTVLVQIAALFPAVGQPEHRMPAGGPS
jgi:hypothetical protein